MAPRSELVPGESLGGWTILRQLAKGGMGAVYAARNELSGAVRALKIVRPDLVADDDTRARFLREVAIASRVRHPHVVEAHDPVVIDGQVVLPMELLEGETLAARLGRGPLDVAESVSLVRTLADAVASIHRSGIIHRDLKPANVFLARDADGLIVPKILDLGAAREIEGPKHTQTGHTIGSPSYMAPEQARAERDLDGRVDVYALGVLLYVTLTCKRPVESDEHGSAIAKLIQGTDVVPPREHRPEVPVALDAIVMQAMAQRREQRFASAEALAAALGALSGELARRSAREVPRTRISHSPPDGGVPPGEASIEDAAPTTRESLSRPAGSWRLAAIVALALAGLLAAGAAAFAAVWAGTEPAPAARAVPPPTIIAPPRGPAPRPAAPIVPATTGSPAGSAHEPMAQDTVAAAPGERPLEPSPAPTPGRSREDAPRRAAGSARPPETQEHARPAARGAGLWLDEP